MEISPDWVVGFVDGAGCFRVRVRRRPQRTPPYEVIPEFAVIRHRRDIQALYALKRFFGCGVVRPDQGEGYAYRVQRLECLERICEFFLRHPLKTRQNVEMRRLRRMVLLMKAGRQESREGLLEIVEVASRMTAADHEALEEIRRALRAG